MTRDPFSGYDAWLSTDRLAEQQEAWEEHLYDLWATWSNDNGIPEGAYEADHVDHALYVQWKALAEATQAWHDERAAEQEAEYAAEEAAYWDAHGSDWNREKEAYLAHNTGVVERY